MSANPELPELLAEMADAVGISAVLALVEWRGGRPLYVPQKLPAGHELINRIGLEGAQWLSQRLMRGYGGHIKIPRASRYVRLLRDQEIRRLHRDEQISANQLAMRYGLDVRTVWDILSADKQRSAAQDHRQSALF
jgi:hypothetical protein